jgi:predicted CopG family antitoxin
MATKTINIRESAYNALNVHRSSAESFSDVIIRLTVSEEPNICNYLHTLDPVVRDEIAGTVRSAKRDLDRIKSKKV